MPMANGLIETLKIDFNVNSFGKVLRCAFSRTGFLAVFIFRIASHLYAKGGIRKVIAMMLTRLNTTLNGCDIQPIADIAPGFFIPHSVGIVIGPSHIGRNFICFHGVTLAREYDAQGNFHHPTIGDHVTIYSGACVSGGVVIGDRVRIGANAVVLKDVPAGALAVGVPARIILPKPAEGTEAQKVPDES